MDEHSPSLSSREDLDQMAGEERPDLTPMSPGNANVVIPVNAAVAANVLSSSAHGPQERKAPPRPEHRPAEGADTSSSP
jgi:hypothetical protein